MREDYSTVTETPGEQISGEAASMLVSRYRLTATLTPERVLEVACGSGQGLAFLQPQVRFACGGDVTPALLATARAHHPRLRLVRFDAHRLPFASDSFDVVAIHEAVYYLHDPEAFVAEAHRVLRPGGRLLVTTINPEWRDFNPSPFAVGYLSAAALHRLLARTFADVRLLGGFAVAPLTMGERVLSLAKRIAIRLRLMPRTMHGKRWLKRLVFGALVAVPATVSDTLAPYDPPKELSTDSSGAVPASRAYKVIYALAARA